MLFGHIVKLFTDNIKIYLINENEKVIEIKTAKEFKRDSLAAWLEVEKIELLNAIEMKVHIK